MASPRPTFDDAQKLLARSEFRALSTALQKAETLVRVHGVSRQIAATACGASKSAVNRAVKTMKNDHVPGVTGRPTALTLEEEDHLMQLIKERALANNALRTWELAPAASEIIEIRPQKELAGSSRSVPDCFVVRESHCPLTSGWRHSFLKRHRGELRTKSPRVLEPERAAVKPDQLRTFFFETLDPLRVQHKYNPSLMANFDETMLQILKDKTQCVIPSSQRLAFTIQEEAPFHITFGMTIFADGTDCKPLLILPQLEFPLGLPPELIHFCTWSGQPAGWISSEIWADWAKKTFLPEIARRRRDLEMPEARALLLVDGHATRTDVVTLNLFRQNKIDLVTFVAHASHLLQPLDLWCYLQFKTQLKGVRSSMRSAPRPEQRKAMIQACERAYRVATAPSIIIRSWERSGVHPWNPSIVLGESDSTGSVPPSIATASTPKRSYVPINNRVVTAPEIVEQLHKQAELRENRKQAKEMKKRQRTAKSNTGVSNSSQN